MAKKRKYHSLPKRIAGIKLPKGLRRYADTPMGGAIIGVTLVELGREALLSPAMSGYVGELRQQFGKAGLALAGGLQHLASSDSGGRKSRRRTPRLEQEELAH
jgi:hypothetical protein